MRKKLLSVIALTVAAPLLLTSCSAQEETAPKEDAVVQENEIVRDEQPTEVNAVENYEAFSNDTAEFVDLSQFAEDWLQIAPMEGQAEDSTSIVWFAVIDAKKAVDVSSAMFLADNWNSTQDSAPQTPEEQLAEMDKVIEENPLEFSGIYYLDDGSSMTVSGALDESTTPATMQYMFSVNRA